MKNNWDLIIIGAGAAGLAAAVAFSEKCSGSVLVIDGNKKSGRKLSTTGNGRCNLTNTHAAGYEITRDFFKKLGFAFAYESEGRVYPLGRQATTVRNALVWAAAAGHVNFMPERKVTDVRRSENDDFIVSANSAPPSDSEYTLTAAQVIVATGGKAGPQYGCYGDGFTFARNFGISVDPIMPSLTKLTYDKSIYDEATKLNGVRVKAHALLLINGRNAAESSGEVQFTDNALSGICIFDLSARYSGYKAEGGSIDEAVVILDLAPEIKESEICELIASKPAAGLVGIVNDKLAVYIRKLLGDIDYEKVSEQAEKISDCIKQFEIPISGTAGWREAQTTIGGVSMSEVDDKHFEAKKVPGLYFAGEVLSSNLPSGGYNLDFAWNTGIAAGARAAGFYNFTQRNGK